MQISLVLQENFAEKIICSGRLTERASAQLRHSVKRFEVMNRLRSLS